MKKKESKKQEKGFIALTSVLIIGAITLILGVSLFHSALTDYSISTAYESGQATAFLADFCVREGIFKLKENIDYMGAEDIPVGNTTCSIDPIENLDDKTKKVSSLGRAGDEPHFSRSSQLIRYVIESKEDDWQEGSLFGDLEITEDSLKLKQFENIIRLNEASGISCGTRCQQEESYQCISAGTGSETADEGDMWEAAFDAETGTYYCNKVAVSDGCSAVMEDYSAELPDACDGNSPCWTYCNCQHEPTEGYRISPEFDISGLYTVKDSQIFWQANERLNGTISVKVGVSHDEGSSWPDWETVETIANGASIPGLEPGTSLSGAKIQTKTSFVGGPDFCPSLENIKIFVELE